MKKQPLIGKLFQWLLNGAVYITLRPKIFWEDCSVKQRIGKEPMILVANHTHHFDGVFVAAIMHKSKPYILVTQKWYDKKRIGKLIQICRCIPIDLNKMDADWYKESQALLQSGKSILIFPEGALAKDGETLPFHSGAALLSATEGVPILPIAIFGSYKLFFGARQRIAIGKPIESNCPETMRHSKYAAVQTQLAEKEVRRLHRIIQDNAVQN